MLFFHLHPFLILLLIPAAAVAGLIDTMAGGGGLITTSLLLLLGLRAPVAIGTSKFQACVGEFNACIHFFKSGKLNLKKLIPGFICIALSSTLGAWVIQWMNPDKAEVIIPWLLLGVVIYSYLSPRFRKEHAHDKMSSKSFFILFGLLIGFYNGFLGPGTGAFWVFLLMFFLRFEFTTASIHAKPLNTLGTFCSVIWFIVGGHVNYPIALTMIVGQFIGTQIGAHLVIHKGNTVVRPLFLCIITIMTLLLFFKQYL